MHHTTCVILAAGKGKRMKSDLPKVMHTLAGQPMIDHVLDKVEALGITEVFTVLGHGKDLLLQHFNQRSQVVYQEEQLGTGHALMQAVPHLKEESCVLVLSGDQPLLSVETLKALLETHKKSECAATVLTAQMVDPTGYGRIVRKDGVFCQIVEEKDAKPEQKTIKEINTGTYCFQAEALKKGLQSIKPQNAQGEYYLTDIFKILISSGKKIATFCTDDYREALGINNRLQLAEAENLIYESIKEYWMLEGVTIVNPSSVLIDTQVEIEKDVIIQPFTILKGRTKIGKGSVIGPGTRLENCTCLAGVQIENSVAKEAVIGENCVIGPYAYLRPGTVLAEGVKVGDFVEVKNSVIGEGSKVPHLSYIGDSTLGKNVNIGAGTITCNYDGRKKHSTVIGDGAFVGSNTNFVAPVEIGKQAVIGAGSTITGNVPDNSLAVERSKQRIINNWRKANN